MTPPASRLSGAGASNTITAAMALASRTAAPACHSAYSAPHSSLRWPSSRPSRSLTLVPRSGAGRAFDGSYDDGDMTGKGVRVYIVDTGVQGSHVDFTGRVVNGHTVGALLVAAHIRRPHSPSAHQLQYHAPQHTLTTRSPLTTPSQPHPIPLAFPPVGSRSPRVRLVPSCQRRPPCRRHWVRSARHPRGLDRRRRKVRRCQECDDCAGILMLQVPLQQRVSSNPNPNS